MAYITLTEFLADNWSEWGGGGMWSGVWEQGGIWQQGWVWEYGHVRGVWAWLGVGDGDNGI